MNGDKIYHYGISTIIRIHGQVKSYTFDLINHEGNFIKPARDVDVFYIALHYVITRKEQSS